MDNTTIKEAISNLESTSNALDAVANSDKYYNTDYGYYLAQLSQAMYRNASELREHQYVLGGV